MSLSLLVKNISPATSNFVYDLNLLRVKVNDIARYLGQRSYPLKIITRTQTFKHTRIHTTDQPLYTTTDLECDRTLGRDV